jgi:hypothetical protein
MAKKESSRPYSVEIQKGPINMQEQYTQKFYREPDHTIRDLENNFMRQEKMTLTLHTPKK